MTLSSMALKWQRHHLDYFLGRAVLVVGSKLLLHPWDATSPLYGDRRSASFGFGAQGSRFRRRRERQRGKWDLGGSSFKVIREVEVFESQLIGCAQPLPNFSLLHELILITAPTSHLLAQVNLICLFRSSRSTSLARLPKEEKKSVAVGA